jgi:hypothetical protein
MYLVNLGLEQNRNLGSKSSPSYPFQILSNEEWAIQAQKIWFWLLTANQWGKKNRIY